MRSLLLLLFLCSYCFSIAQKDSNTFRCGKLKNGLTYYIRHTAAQPGYADYYLVQNVGSLMEDEDQNGLAHVLEHMAFRSDMGLKHLMPLRGMMKRYTMLIMYRRYPRNW